MALTAAARPAFASYCAIHPINPMCCPTPCPVIDMSKAAQVLGEIENAWQKVEQCRAIADRYYSLFMSFGPSGPLATELRRVPGNVANVVAAYKTAVPSMLKPGDLKDPRAVAEILKKAMFDPASLEVNQLTDRLQKTKQMAVLAADESFNALASGLNGYARLTEVAADGGRQIALASKSGNARSDMAANIAARQALVDNIAGLQLLLTSWAATQATSSAATNVETLGPVPSPSVSAPASAATAAIQQRVGELGVLRQARMAVNEMDGTISALAALHNDRHAAQIMLAQYPALKNTVDSDEAAIRFRDAETANASALLGQIFVDPASAFQVARGQLQALDITGWRDGAAKSEAAGAAAAALVTAIEDNPAAFGQVKNARWHADAQGNYDDTLPGQLRTSFAAWLEDDKLERFWQPLRHDAEQAMRRLDNRMAEINSRRGFDISGPAARDRESALIDQFNRQAQALPALDGQSPRAKTAMIGSVVGAFRRAAASVQADADAAGFVSVAWPQ